MSHRASRKMKTEMSPEMNDPIFYTRIESPLGKILLVKSERGLRRINFEEGEGAISPRPEWTHQPDAFEAEADQLRRYFEGELKEFDLALDAGGTAFQTRVWNALVRIPYGETKSYVEIARSLGKPTASRAIGGANRRNSLPIVVPCHRVIGADGSLAGYYGGVQIKQALLDLEAGASRKPVMQGSLFA